MRSSLAVVIHSQYLYGKKSISSEESFTVSQDYEASRNQAHSSRLEKKGKERQEEIVLKEIKIPNISSWVFLFDSRTSATI
jgi:hypothetical protein